MNQMEAMRLMAERYGKRLIFSEPQDPSFEGYTQFHEECELLVREDLVIGSGNRNMVFYTALFRNAENTALFGQIMTENPSAAYEIVNAEDDKRMIFWHKNVVSVFVPTRGNFERWLRYVTAREGDLDCRVCYSKNTAGDACGHCFAFVCQECRANPLFDWSRCVLCRQ
jgi:hypothetical protein